MEIATINISLPQVMKDEVETFVSGGGYANTSEFFRDLVRNYKEQRRQKTLESLIIEGLDSPSSPLTKADFDELRAAVTSRFAERGKKIVCGLSNESLP